MRLADGRSIIASVILLRSDQWTKLYTLLVEHVIVADEVVLNHTEAVTFDGTN